MELDYYTEELTAVPFKVMRRALKVHLPDPFATALSAFFRLRGKLGWHLTPSYATADAQYAELIGVDDLPAAVTSKWWPYWEQLRELEFTPVVYRRPKLIGAKQQIIGVFLSADRSILATLEWMRLPAATGIVEEVCCEFNSYGSRDPEIYTGMAKPEHLLIADMFSLDFVDLLMLPNTQSVRSVLEKHRARIDQSNVFSFTPEAAHEEYLKRGRRRSDALKKLGLIRKLKPREVATVKAKSLPPL